MTAEALAPGIVGAVAFFLVMFALVAAYWRCGRLREDGRSRRRRQANGPSWEAPTGGETHLGGCRITINPLDDAIEMGPVRGPTAQPRRKVLADPQADSRCRQESIAEDDGDFDDLASLLSSSDDGSSSGSGSEEAADSCSGSDEADENCERCRREARLASPEEADIGSDNESISLDDNDAGIEFADEDPADAASDMGTAESA